MKTIIFFIVFLFLCSSGLSTELQTVTGVVLDAVTKEPLEGVSIKNEETKKIVASDHKGQFIIETDSKKIELTAEITGYQRISRQLVYPYQEVTLEMQLANENMLGAIYVKDKSQIEGSKQKIDKEHITKTTTHLFSDTLKVVQTLPGVITGDDFSSLMYVRGGEFYETISFLDNIHILTPYVWGGNQSIFNPSFVEKVDFYSGGFPVKYFQGLSAVIDVKNREGNYQERKGFVDLSATSFESVLEGPIEKDKISYIVGARRTYYDLLLKYAL
ncbi:MAG: carboxypeptidase-like regulatory domain-containing protein [Elusimicrobia bacterium]|nr:carboxypeptidase-like regulatory domain-containing protein [Elusimicrobiota bacterium]